MDAGRAVLVALRRIIQATDFNANLLARQTELATSQLLVLQLLEGSQSMTIGDLANENYIADNADFASPDEVSTFVRVNRFNDSSIDMLLYCFTRTTDWGAWLKIKEELAYKVKEIVEGAGTGFAFPSQSLYVHALPSEKPDVFTPRADD